MATRTDTLLSPWWSSVVRSAGFKPVADESRSGSIPPSGRFCTGVTTWNLIWCSKYEVRSSTLLSLHQKISGAEWCSLHTDDSLRLQIIRLISRLTTIFVASLIPVTISFAFWWDKLEARPDWIIIKTLFIGNTRERAREIDYNRVYNSCGLYVAEICIRKSQPLFFAILQILWTNMHFIFYFLSLYKTLILFREMKRIISSQRHKQEINHKFTRCPISWLHSSVPRRPSVVRSAGFKPIADESPSGSIPPSGRFCARVTTWNLI